MFKFGDLGSKCSKTKDKFEISSFKIGYMQNYVKIRKFILFGPKCPNLGIWAQNLKKTWVIFGRFVFFGLFQLI